MKRFTESGRTAIAADQLYVGLTLALILPDICGSLEDPGPGKSQRRYEKWCREWLEPKFTAQMPDGPMTFLTASDCFQLRCSLIHSGRADVEPGKVTDIERFEFFDNSYDGHMNKVGSLQVDGVEHGNFLQLNVAQFSNSMFDAADEWDASIIGNAAVCSEKEKLLKIRSKGFVAGKFGVLFGS